MLRSPLVRIVSGVVAGMATLTWLHYRPPWQSRPDLGGAHPGMSHIDVERDKLTVGFLPVT